MWKENTFCRLNAFPLVKGLKSVVWLTGLLRIWSLAGRQWLMPVILYSGGRDQMDQVRMAIIKDKNNTGEDVVK
jgi:hypothetical protein